jgi:two-component system, NarL family, response regulator NreC
LPYSVLLVDDSPMIRRSLRFLIEHNTEWQVCGEAENGKIAVEQVEQLHPDAVILDFQMPVMNGLEAAQQISQLAPNTAMVMFTMHDSAQLRHMAQAAGIRSVITKTDRFAEHLMVSLGEAVARRGIRPTA